MNNLGEMNCGNRNGRAKINVKQQFGRQILRMGLACQSCPAAGVSGAGPSVSAARKLIS